MSIGFVLIFLRKQALKAGKYNYSRMTSRNHAFCRRLNNPNHAFALARKFQSLPLYLLLVPGALQAQSVIAPPPARYAGEAPAISLSGDAYYEDESNLLGTTLDLGTGALQWGITHLQPSLLYRLIVGDGFRSSLDDQRSENETTVIHEFYPSVSLNLRDKARVNYTPVFRMYSRDDLDDTVDHRVSFTGHTAYKDWSFNLTQTYVNTAQPLSETGTQTEQEAFLTTFGAGWSLNSSDSLEFGLVQNLRFASSAGDEQNLVDSKNWSGTVWFNHKFWNNLSGAIGAGAGYFTSSRGSDTVFEQLLARLQWRVQQKLLLSAYGGASYGQILDSPGGTQLSPTFQVAADYAILETTTLRLNARRSFTPSYYQNTVNERTEVRLGVNQRLLGKLYLNVDGGYRIASYQSTLDEFDETREDETAFYGARLSMEFLKRASAALFFYRSDHTSSTAGYGYDSSQVGLEIGYRF